MILALILSIENEDDRLLLLNLYMDYFPLMKSVAFDVVKNLDTAEDIVHDAIIKTIDHVDKLRGRNKKQVVSYVCKVVESVAIDYYRKNMKSPKSAVPLAPEDMETFVDNISPDMAKSVEYEEQYRVLGLALDKLSDRDRQLLTYKYWMDLSDKEIALKMDMEHTNVRVSLLRAKKRAKDILTKVGFVYESP